jgi:hypothetical protein
MRATGFADAPSAISCPSSGESFDAYVIVREWDARGWPRPVAK